MQRPPTTPGRPAGLDDPPPGHDQVQADEPVGPHHERGQATAEYALVMLAAAALAGLLLAWAASTDGVSRLLNAVIDSIIKNAR